MHTANESRKESSKPVRLLAAAVFLVMVGSGYAISTHSEGAADQAAIAIPAIAAVEQSQSYFPAQFVNQGAAEAAAEEIPTF